MRIEAYVVVSDDDKLADHTGAFPDALKNDAEWTFFQDGLDRADVTILGRRSHEATPNHRARRRLVMTRHPEKQPAEDNVIYWNPEDTSLQQALSAFGNDMTHLAVVGGQAVFDYFLIGPHRYTVFHLSRVHGVTLPGGIGVFKGVEDDGMAAEDVLYAAGYTPSERRSLDKHVDVVGWIPVT